MSGYAVKVTPDDMEIVSFDDCVLEGYDMFWLNSTNVSEMIGEMFPEFPVIALVNKENSGELNKLMEFVADDNICGTCYVCRMTAGVMGDEDAEEYAGTLVEAGVFENKEEALAEARKPAWNARDGMTKEECEKLTGFFNDCKELYTQLS